MHHGRNQGEEMPAYQKGILEIQGYMAGDLIGQGAFGKVYRIWDVKKRCNLACKVSDNNRAREILRCEAGIHEQITHPLFARYEACLESKEATMLLMEYVEGENLEHYLQRERLTQEQTVAVAIQLAEGIDYLHSMPDALLYRDLKPENICLTPSGKVRLLDLGCVCRVKEARFSHAGSPGYVPVEQMCDENRNVTLKVPGFYSDVYALGKLMHYMLTGDNPVMPPYVKPTVRAYNLSCSPYLEQIILQCTQEKVEMRLPDMKCVLQNLKVFQEDGIRARLRVKRREIEVVTEHLFSRKANSGFIYERNVCCQPSVYK